MAEYIVVLAFGIMVLLGPGRDIMAALRDVIKNNYRGYSYAMSVSPLPDFDTGGDLRAYLETLDPDLEPATIDRLAMDPIGDATDSIYSQLAAFSDVESAFDRVADELGGDPEALLTDLATDMLQDAIFPF